MGWNVNIRDDDGHPVYDVEGNVINSPREVTIEDHVWIVSYVDILKGVTIKNNNIIGYKTFLTKSFIETNSIIAGNPPQVIKKGIDWEN